MGQQRGPKCRATSIAGDSGADLQLVKIMERDSHSSKRERGENEQEKQEAKRLKGTIVPDGFSCDACTKPLKPPVFQCSTGHFFLCSSCHDKLPKCQICTGGSSLERSYGMDRAVQSVLVDCRYADLGCQRKFAYYDKKSHESACPHAPYSCLYSGCGFTGLATELLDHLTAHHKCPCTEFEYWFVFELPVKPGVHVVHCKDDDQHFLVHTQPAEQAPGYAVSIGCMPPCVKESGIGCSVSFECSDCYTGISTLRNLRSSMAGCTTTSMDYLCFVPKVPGGPDGGDGGVVLAVNIVCAPAENEYFDGDYVETDDEFSECS